ncbi:ribosomal RNA small subunit methyltransferase A [Desulfopila sp. IMCC35006]|uniref:16S rRNA (adenine(1518)-N(6)/adenine(1519)-N(6))- dimethyltransferase RsmA n=1 Tax=Desulfopila sp. IMCC35006 TaxID=2569542 RepID=UPI0010AD31FA|nr:16S rRNA (adenine(1518)-N(6)/adenine(1519)-N(6))-dimethyltransferase RsmA [Desulfopila sp. IMCC35006]TKB27335.1 ribosomal RNA small subunit methyltransferase A [Desulfopila sp. IMCC35006]
MTKYGHQTREALQNNQLAPKKRFGQNFLVHKMTAEAIVRAGKVCSDDTILEVGVGLGALTSPLAATAKHVFGYEIDSGIIRYHQEQKDLPDNVTLVHQDILSADFQEVARQCGGSLKILANLPYSISNPFIFKLIDNASLISTATIMLQKEVADRLMAAPNTKEYGVPTVLLASCATVHKLMTLKPGEFHPRPKVDSVVVTLDFRQGVKRPSDAGHYDFALFRQLVRTTFNQRRKTILNTLTGAGLFGDSIKQDKVANKERTCRAIERANLQPNSRPETLTCIDFINLAIEIARDRSSL